MNNIFHNFFNDQVTIPRPNHCETLTLQQTTQNRNVNDFKVKSLAETTRLV